MSKGTERSLVFPTHVGVFPPETRPHSASSRLPHACGGVSVSISFEATSILVFPTHVGVFPFPTCPARIWNRLPHACGGVSYSCMTLSLENTSSPRMWGCFPAPSLFRHTYGVFPTHVGVFLSCGDALPYALCLPHACGGVSAGDKAHPPNIVSSPRMWGCFRIEQLRTRLKKVFPTHVGRATKPPSSRSGAFPLFYSRQLTLGRSVS